MDQGLDPATGWGHSFVTDVSELHKELGILIGQVEALQKDIDKADQTRRKVHERIDELVDDFGQVRHDIKTLKGGFDDLVVRTNDIQGVTDEVKRWKQRGIGALAMTGLGGAGIGATIMKFLELFSKPPG